MRYVAAYMLAVLGGNVAPTAADIEKILSSVGIEAEADKLNKVISELKGKDLDTLIAEGSAKLASMPAAGSAPAPAAAPAAAAAAAPAPVKEEKKEEKQEESEDEEDGMFGLFD